MGYRISPHSGLGAQSGALSILGRGAVHGSIRSSRLLVDSGIARGHSGQASRPLRHLDELAVVSVAGMRRAAARLQRDDHVVNCRFIDVEPIHGLRTARTFREGNLLRLWHFDFRYEFGHRWNSFLGLDAGNRDSRAHKGILAARILAASRDVPENGRPVQPDTTSRPSAASPPALRRSETPDLASTVNSTSLRILINADAYTATDPRHGSQFAAPIQVAGSTPGFDWSRFKRRTPRPAASVAPAPSNRIAVAGSGTA